MHIKFYSLVLLFSSLIKAQNSDPGAAIPTDGTIAGPGTPADGLCVNGLCFSVPSLLAPTNPFNSQTPPYQPKPSKQPKPEPKPPNQSGTFITTETVISVQAGPKTTLTITLAQTRTTTIIAEIPGPTVTAGGATFTTVTKTEEQTRTTTAAAQSTSSPSRETVTVTGSFSESTTGAQTSRLTSVTTTRTGVSSSSRSPQTTSFVTVNGAAYPTGAIMMGALFGGAAAIANF